MKNWPTLSEPPCIPMHFGSQQGSKHEYKQKYYLAKKTRANRHGFKIELFFKKETAQTFNIPSRVFFHDINFIAKF